MYQTKRIHIVEDASSCYLPVMFGILCKSVPSLNVLLYDLLPFTSAVIELSTITALRAF
jgi:hypothetical protein